MVELIRRMNSYHLHIYVEFCGKRYIVDNILGDVSFTLVRKPA